jgi:sporulation protein YlmC with PRC-barrel domain
MDCKNMIQKAALGTIAALLMAAGSATAQQDATNKNSQPNKPATTQPVDPKMPRETDHAKMADRGVTLIPSSWALGTDITTRDGETLGEVDDLLISTHCDRIAYVILSRGGVAGIGTTTYAIPHGAFTWNDAKRVLELPITKVELDAAPKLETNDWKVLMDPARSARLYDYYKIDKDHRFDPNKSFRDGQLSREDEAARTKADEATKQWPLIKCSQLKGQTLMSDQGSELGKINEVVFDCPTGRIAFAAVSFGGVLGIGDKKVLVPWDMFNVNKEGKLFATGIDPETVKAAPRVDFDDWRQLREDAYGTNVYTHFKRDGKWLERRSTDRSRLDREVRYPEYDRLYATGSTVDATGLVMLVEPTRPMKDMPEITSVALTTDDKQSYVIHLAPAWYLQDQGVTLKTGDRVSFKGRWAEIDGKRYLLASQIVPATGGKTYIIRRDDGTRQWEWR